ncbi:LysE family translocator [Streptomyces sp. DSM 41527]|uniref:LysE family translocator n=1 Tax=Streptomyces mooreae TaxID=3075523 RepID=A0ABU2T3N4_9ACTN|nr:LysE family translocator [Streptomyces sp. DSM 41527]MDT0455844.1 LysE family translocator [Streptomyces sp. DSM 41527]
MTNFIGYIAVAGLIVVSPGADTLVVIRNALHGGARAAVQTAAGVCTGLVAWAVASVAGLSAVLAASPALFTAIKIAGAAYLVFLGIRAIASARRPLGDVDTPTQLNWRQGAVTSLGNPKVGVFYTSFLPQFIPAGNGSLPVSLTLAGIHIALSFLCLCGYALLVLRLGNIFKRDGWRRALETVGGGALCAIGTWLVVSAVA